MRRIRTYEMAIYKIEAEMQGIKNELIRLTSEFNESHASLLKIEKNESNILQHSADGVRFGSFSFNQLYFQHKKDELKDRLSLIDKKTQAVNRAYNQKRIELDEFKDILNKERKKLKSEEAKRQEVENEQTEDLEIDEKREVNGFEDWR